MATATGWLLGAQWSLGLPLAPLLGHLSDRYGRVRVTSGGFALGAVGLLSAEGLRAEPATAAALVEGATPADGVVVDDSTADPSQALAFTVRPSMLALAGEVARRARTGLLTNNSPLLEEAFPKRFPGVCQAFDPILFSHQFGDTKPSVALFEKVAARLELPPDLLEQAVRRLTIVVGAFGLIMAGSIALNTTLHFTLTTIPLPPLSCKQ